MTAAWVSRAPLAAAVLCLALVLTAAPASAQDVGVDGDDGVKAGLPVLTLGEWKGSSEKPRVAIVASEFSGIVPNGGVGTFYTALARELSSAGHNVTLLYTQGTRSHSSLGDFGYWRDHYASQGVDLVPVAHAPHYGSSYHASVSFRAFLELSRLHDASPFDVIHFPDWQGHGYYSVLAKRLGIGLEGAVTCVMTHGPLRWARLGNGESLYDPSDLECDFLERSTIRLADVLVSPSRYLIRWIKDKGWAVPEGSVHVQPYLTPNTGGGEGEGRKVAGSNPVDEIVFFGRWEARKGVRTFCDAVGGLVAVMAERGDLNTELKVTFMGSDRGTIEGIGARAYVESCVSDWRAIAEPSPISRVSLLSDLDSRQAHDYLRGRNCVAVLPSLFENSPLSVFELIEMGVPFFASDAGGIPELIHPSSLRGGTVFEAGSSSELRDRLETALATPARDLVVRGAHDKGEVRRQWVEWHEGVAAGGTCEAAPGGEVDPQEVPPKALSLCLVLRGSSEANAVTLRSLAAQESRPNEVLLWESSSEGGSFLVESGFPEPRKLDLGAAGLGENFHSSANNACARQASGTHVGFLRSGQVLMRGGLGSLWGAAAGAGADLTTSFMSLYAAPRGALQVSRT